MHRTEEKSFFVYVSKLLFFLYWSDRTFLFWTWISV